MLRNYCPKAEDAYAKIVFQIGEPVKYMVKFSVISFCGSWDEMHMCYYSR
jgi:hypothetical protein